GLVLRKGAMKRAFDLQRVGYRAFREEAVDQCGEVGEEQITQCRGIAEVLTNGKFACAYPCLEIRQLAPTVKCRFAEIRVTFGWKGLHVCRVAKVEIGMIGHFGVVEHPVEDFQLRNRSPAR